MRAVFAGSAVLGILLTGGANGRGDARDNHSIPRAKPADQNAAEILQLDLGCDTADGSRLQRLLARDQVKVVWADTGAGGEMTIRVKMKVARFKTIFKGELVKLVVARSSCDGFVTEQFIERYVIPRRYRGSLQWIRLPDPQIE